MRLLVSVRDADEAAVAVDAGADIVDAKDPAHGALGPVSPDTLAAITRTVAGRRPVSAALGDLGTDHPAIGIQTAARAAVRAGINIAKVGVDPRSTPRQELTVADLMVVDCVLALELCGQTDIVCPFDVVLGLYADLLSAARCPPDFIVDAAAQLGAAGLLLDTSRKNGRSLFDVMAPSRVAPWVAAAHAAGLFVTLAGSLDVDDVSAARDCGADIMGVRGAACSGGRCGSIAFERVQALVSAVRAGSPP
jgi:uncharacterized protein (UPF0264 family)